VIVSKDKTTIRQVVILFFMASLSPTIRLFPQMAARTSGKAGWLAPIVAAVPIIILIYIINAFFKKNKGVNLSDVYCNILGKIVGKIVISLYLIWVLVLLSLYIRYYSERLLSSMMPNISHPYLIIVMLCLVFFATKCGLGTIARANEIFFIIFILVFVLSFVFTLPQIKYSYLMKVSYKDAWPACKSSFAIISVWGFFLYIFFFGDKISNKEHIKRFSFRMLGALFITCTLLLIMTIGSLGSILTGHVGLPFFMVVKNITIAGTIGHIESIILALWIISDFIIISIFTIMSTSILKSLFNLSGTRSMLSPVLLFAGIGSLIFFKNRFEMETLSSFILPAGSIVLEFIIPIIIFTIGKIRKII